ncbi:MAG: amidohydrolase family protein, partial [Candidatus Geothermarchaeales archaeon]
IIHCTHVAETKGEAEEVRKAFGVAVPGGSLFRYLDELDVLSDQFLAAHCVYPTKTDTEIMRKRGVKASHNIVSNFKLGNGLSPISDMIRQGITVSLGTDSASSNNSLDMFETMKYVALAQKFGSGDPTALPASQSFRLATIEGGKALCWQDLGWLRPGFLADIVTIRLRKPHLTPLYDEYSHLVYAVKGSDVSTVVVDGELVVHNGRLIPLDVEGILDAVSRKALELQERATDVNVGGRP